MGTDLERGVMTHVQHHSLLSIWPYFFLGSYWMGTSTLSCMLTGLLQPDVYQSATCSLLEVARVDWTAV